MSAKNMQNISKTVKKEKAQAQPRKIAADAVATGRSYKNMMLIGIIILLMSIIGAFVGYVVADRASKRESVQTTHHQSDNDKHDAKTEHSETDAANPDGKQDAAGTGEHDSDNGGHAAPQPSDSTPPADSHGTSPGHPFTDVHQIAYLTYDSTTGQHNVGVVDTNGEHNRILIHDLWTPLAWKSDTELIYADCDGGCAVKSVNITDGSIATVWTAIPFTQSIDELAWNGGTLAVLLRKGDDSFGVYAIDTATSTARELRSYPPLPARDGGLTDNRELEVSYDGSHVIAIDTFIDPSVSPPSGLWSSSGTEELLSDDALMIDFDRSGRVFTQDYVPGLDSWNLNIYDATGSTVLSSTDFEPGYYEEVSPDGRHISFMHSDTVTSEDTERLHVYEVGEPVGSDIVIRFHRDAEWIDNDHLATIRTATTSSVEGMYGPIYDPIGIDILDITKPEGSRTIVSIPIANVTALAVSQ